MVRDVYITSFDGVRLAATVFTPEDASRTNKVPYVLMTHGWAGERVTTPTGRVAALLDAGYGVITWDSRGFGASGGEVMLNSPDYEVRDVSVLVSYLGRGAAPYALRTGTDPVVGMSGVSYAGGIQLLAAAFDDRIDAIAPEITWNDLAQALGPNGVPKLYWTSLLFGAGAESSCVNARNGAQPGNPTRVVETTSGAATGAASLLPGPTTGCQTSDLALYYAMVHGTNSIPDEVREALDYRSPKTYMSEIDIPTLLIQGFPDTLFDVDQAAANYEGIKANGAPVKLWLYDGGHGHPEGPALPATQESKISATVVNWFDRHLKGDTGVDTGAEVQYYTNGAWRNATSWPDPAATAMTKEFGGFPMLMQGPLTGGPPSSFTAVLAPGPAVVAGPASMSFQATGLGAEGILFLTLGVQNAGVITPINAQTQPVRFPVSTDGTTLVSTDLVAGEAVVPAGASLVVTVGTLHRDYDGNRVPGYVNIKDIDVSWTKA